jgi:hypothetical protein
VVSLVYWIGPGATVEQIVNLAPNLRGIWFRRDFPEKFDALFISGRFFCFGLSEDELLPKWLKDSRQTSTLSRSKKEVQIYAARRLWYYNN